MNRALNAHLDDSIADTLGTLYERKVLGNNLIQVLEQYRRCSVEASRVHRTCRPTAPVQNPPNKELRQLYLRRAAVDMVIRCIEAYSAQPTCR